MKARFEIEHIKGEKDDARNVSCRLSVTYRGKEMVEDMEPPRVYFNGTPEAIPPSSVRVKYTLENSSGLVSTVILLYRYKGLYSWVEDPLPNTGRSEVLRRLQPMTISEFLRNDLFSSIATQRVRYRK